MNKHRSVIAPVAPWTCWEGDCPELIGADGLWIDGKDTCSHFEQQEICPVCSHPPGTDVAEQPEAVAWADCPHNPTRYQDTGGAL